MTTNNKRIIDILNGISDGCLTFAAYFVAALLRFDYMAGSKPAIDFVLTREYFAAFAVYSVCIVVAYALLQLYDIDRRKTVAQEIGIVLAANMVGTLAMTTVLYLLHLADFSRITLAFFFLFSSFGVLCKRLILRVVLHRSRMLGRDQKHVVVVGNGHLAFSYVDEIRSDKQYGLVLDGYVSRSPKENLGVQLGAYEDLDDILARLCPDEVVIALEPHEDHMMPVIISACEKQGVRTSIIPFYNDYLPSHPYVETIGNSKLINIRKIPLDALGNAILKRAFDIIASMILICISSPIMLVVAIGVKLSSPGPILFCQERVGLNKKMFKMLKFRSMRVDIDHDGWTKDEDPRKTKFGSFIRKFSLDELPQFFNVLCGDMSLIGPRPEIPHFVEQFTEEIPLYLVRQQVRPGITGWAQVNGFRGDTSIVKRVKCDIWYIENWTWLLDIKILFMTVFGGMVNSEKINSDVDVKDETKSVQ